MPYALLAPLICLFLIAGCATAPVPAPPDRENTYALAEPETTRLARMLAEHTPAQQPVSGFSAIETGRETLLSIRSFVALAEKTLDLQYYIWRADRTGRALLLALVDAADRGVRVRLLLDDMDMAWEDDELAKLNAHPNFEVRIFNPFAYRDRRWLDLLLDFQRVTHRMHNKVFIADNTVAIVGGRNIGDRYFSADEARNYRDLDLHAAGPITRELSKSFDDFWNSRWSISVDSLDGGRRTPEDVRTIVEKLKRAIAGHEHLLPVRGGAWGPAAKYVEKVFSELVWTRHAAVLADTPKKVRTSNSRLVRELADRLTGDLDEELLIESAYFIPGDRGVKALCGFVKRGIRVRILTNSLSSSDVITTYAGYRKYRPELLRCGVELYELKTDAAFTDDDWTWVKGTSSANLHSKVAVIDGRYVFVGSFNLDPRSVNLNTEIALLVRSRRLADTVSAFIENGMSPENAYRLTLDDGEIVWHTGGGDGPARLTEEPGATFWRLLVSSLIALLPIEGQL